MPPNELLVLQKPGDSRVSIEKPAWLSFTREMRLLEVFVWSPFELGMQERKKIRLGVFRDFMKDAGCENPYDFPENQGTSYLNQLVDIFDHWTITTRELIDDAPFKEMDHWTAQWYEKWETKKKSQS